MFRAVLFYNLQNLKTTQMFLNGKWINQLWYIHIMKYLVSNKKDTSHILDEPQTNYTR